LSIITDISEEIISRRISAEPTAYAFLFLSILLTINGRLSDNLFIGKIDPIPPHLIAFPVSTYSVLIDFSSRILIFSYSYSKPALSGRTNALRFTGAFLVSAIFSTTSLKTFSGSSCYLTLEYLNI
jgi:hypothetical protein